MRSFAALVLGTVGVLIVLGSMAHQANGAGTVFIKRGIIPGLASDSAPAPAQPLPTSTPGAPLGLQLVVRVNMVANELAYSGTAAVPITLTAKIEGPVPSGPPVHYLSGAIVEAHPGDVCSWGPEFAKTALDMTATLQTTIFPPKRELTLVFDGPKWHFGVQCGPALIRVPASGEESLPGWLGLITGAADAVPVEITSYNGEPKCIHDSGTYSRSNAWGTVVITVSVVTPPCSGPTGAP
jgi:hypothetical protein